MRTRADILDDLATCDRVAPRLRDAGDLDDLDARRAELQAELQAVAA